MFLNPLAPLNLQPVFTFSLLHSLFALIALVILTATGLFSALAHPVRYFRPRNYPMYDVYDFLVSLLKHLSLTFFIFSSLY